MQSRSEHGPDATLPLNNETLNALAPHVAVPTYDRTTLTPAIVHFSVGGFHRAHQAVYLDELARRGVATDWGVVGVGLHRRDMKDALMPQDYLYTVVERGAAEDTARVVGTLLGYLFAPEESDAVLDTLADERTRLVTMTITRDGYPVDPVTGAFKEDDAEIQADLAHPHRPSTVCGYICEALDRRRAAGIAPFSVLSCDNMQDNGAVTREMIVSFARLRDAELARWIEENVAFPSSMVDRITPTTTPETREEVVQTFGVEDRWPVVTEEFAQWIVQDTFCNGRPPLEEVGVQFVPDVAPYELMKTRLLNASHCALGYLGYLSGYRRTDEAMADPLLRDYIARLMDEEVTPLLPDVPGIDLADYTRTLLERFANPKVGDQLDRLCGRGSTKMPAYLLPSIAEALERGRPTALLTLAVAGWFRYLRGVDFAGETIEIKDARKERLQSLALTGGTDPRPLLGEYEVFGSLGQHPVFAESLEQALLALDHDGVKATIGAYLAYGEPYAA
jgi:mannitol-1-phosphate/altronate dehydrogenase